MLYVADDFKVTTLFEDDIIEGTANSHSSVVLNSTTKSINKELDASPTISADYSTLSCLKIHLETVNNNFLFTSAFHPKINLQKPFLQNESSIQVTENDSTKIIDTIFISQSLLKCIQTVPTVNNQSNCLTDGSKFEDTIKNIQENDSTNFLFKPKNKRLNYKTGIETTNRIDSADALILNKNPTILQTSLDKDFAMKLVDRPSTILNYDVQSPIGQLETHNAANILLNISSELSNQQRNQIAKDDSTKIVEIATSKPLSDTIQITPTDDSESTYSSSAEYDCNQTQIVSHGSTSMITNNAPVVLNSFLSNSKNHYLNSNGLLYKTVKVLHDTYGFVVLPNIWQSVQYKDFNITMFFDSNTFCKKVSFNNSLVPYIHINNKVYEYSKAIQFKHELEYLLKDIYRNNVCLGLDRIVYNKCISYTNSKLCRNCKSTINYEKLSCYPSNS